MLQRQGDVSWPPSMKMLGTLAMAKFLRPSWTAPEPPEALRVCEVIKTVSSKRYQSEPRGLTGASETKTKSGTTESIILDDYAQLDSIPGSIGVVTSRSLPGSAKRRRGLQTAKSGAESACDDKFGETKAKSVIDSRRSAIGVERRAVGTESLGDYFADVLSR